jgi:hypothetical protein
MTTDLLTFFQPEESSGTASTFSVGFSNGPAIEVWLFTREKADLSRFAKAAVSSDDEWKNLDREIQTALQPGGGLLVYAQPYNGGVKVQLLRREAPGYTPPKRMLHLNLSGNAQLEDIKSVVDLEIGDHLVLPVNDEAERRLTALRDNLKGLPPDLESSVLNIIRRPSLEWRLDRIERTLSIPPATRAEQQRVRSGKLLDRLYDLVMRPIPIGPAIAAALLLMAGTLFAHNKFSYVSNNNGNEYADSKPKKPTPADFKEVTTTPKQPEPKKIKPEDLEASMDALFTALGTTDDQPIKGLYVAHFKDHQKDAFKSPDVSWGITKLQALELGFIDKNHPKFKLNDRLAWTDTETVYRDEMNLSNLKENKNAVDLLAYTWCQPTNTPALPATSKYEEPLPLKGTCDDVKPEDAIPGLEALTDWVKKQKKPKK